MRQPTPWELLSYGSVVIVLVITAAAVFGYLGIAITNWTIQAGVIPKSYTDLLQDAWDFYGRSIPAIVGVWLGIIASELGLLPWMEVVEP